jgi:hypothetical protein
MKLDWEYALFPNISQAHDTFGQRSMLGVIRGKAGWVGCNLREIVTFHYKVSAGISGAVGTPAFTARPSSMTDIA